MPVDIPVEISFDGWARERFTAQLRSFADTLLERVVPLFDDVDGEADRAAEEVLSWSCWNDDNYDQAYEQAQEAALERAWQFLELRSAFLATGVSGLSHLFEKQIYKHLNHEMMGWLEVPVSEWNDVKTIFRIMNRKRGSPGPCSELIDAISDADLVELRLVSNAIKHGEGNSLERLQRMGAAVVSPDRLREDPDVGPHSILGVSISIGVDDVKRYRDAAIRFWALEGTFWAPSSSFVP